MSRCGNLWEGVHWFENRCYELVAWVSTFLRQGGKTEPSVQPGGIACVAGTGSAAGTQIIASHLASVSDMPHSTAMLPNNSGRTSCKSPSSQVRLRSPTGQARSHSIALWAYIILSISLSAFLNQIQISDIEIWMVELEFTSLAKHKFNINKMRELLP